MKIEEAIHKMRRNLKDIDQIEVSGSEIFFRYKNYFFSIDQVENQVALPTHNFFVYVGTEKFGLSRFVMELRNRSPEDLGVGMATFPSSKFPKGLLSEFYRELYDKKFRFDDILNDILED